MERSTNQLPEGVIAYYERVLEFIEGEGRTREMPDSEALLRAKQETYDSLVVDGTLTQTEADKKLERERAALEGCAGVKSIELLALYALARDLFTLQEAANVLAADRGEAQRAFDIIRTALAADRAGRWTIFHSAFREYFLYLGEYAETKLHRYEETIARVQDGLLGWCARWQEHRSSYALRHYPEHLLAAGRWDQLYALARNEGFLQAQAQTLIADPYVPLRTIRSALEGAITQGNADGMTEFSLNPARQLMQVTRESPRRHARAGCGGNSNLLCR